MLGLEKSVFVGVCRMHWGYTSPLGLTVVVCLLVTEANAQETLSNILLPRQPQDRKIRLFPSSDSLNIQLQPESNGAGPGTSSRQQQQTRDSHLSQPLAEIGSVGHRYVQMSNPLVDSSLQRQWRNGSMASTALEPTNLSQGGNVKAVQQQSGTIPSTESQPLSKKVANKRLGNSPARQSSEVFPIISKPEQILTISVKAGQQIELDTRLGVTVHIMETNGQETKSVAQPDRTSSSQANTPGRGWRISIHRTPTRTVATQPDQGSVTSPKDDLAAQTSSPTETYSNNDQTYDTTYQSDPLSNIWPYWTGFGLF